MHIKIKIILLSATMATVAASAFGQGVIVDRPRTDSSSATNAVESPASPGIKDGVSNSTGSYGANAPSSGASTLGNNASNGSGEKFTPGEANRSTSPTQGASSIGTSSNVKTGAGASNSSAGVGSAPASGSNAPMR